MQMINMFSDNDIQDSVVVSEEYAKKLEDAYIEECNKVSKQFANRRKKDMLEAQGGNIIGDLSEETYRIVGRYGDKSIKF